MIEIISLPKEKPVEENPENFYPLKKSIKDCSICGCIFSYNYFDISAESSCWPSGMKCYYVTCPYCGTLLDLFKWEAEDIRPKGAMRY